MIAIIPMKGIFPRKYERLIMGAKKTSRQDSKQSSSKKKERRKGRKPNSLWKWIGLGVVSVAVITAVILIIPRISGNLHISAAEAYQKFQQGAYFLDVRTQEEWNQSHIANSNLIPLDELQNRLSELPKDRDIVVVCLSGHRSEEGVTILREAGFSRARCMTGGLTAWKVAGYPLVASNP
jgi:rhodanese-related sulfurtransferase